MKKQFIIGFLIAFLSLIPIVNAPTTVDISNIPLAFSEALGISLFAGQILSSTILVSLFLFPTLLLTGKKDSGIFAVLLVGILTTGVCVAISWLPVWMLLIWVFIVALLLGTSFKQILS